MTSYIIPCLLAFVTLFALGQKIDVYNALVRGAENGLNVTFRIVPSLVALLTGVSMLRASGALDCLTALLSPLMNAVGIPPEITPGEIIGSVTRKKVRNSLAPSILAASSRELGIFSENCFIRNTPKGHPTTGKITANMEPQTLFNSPRLDISVIRGIRITCFGRAIAHTNRPKIRPFPQKRFFARAYPAREEVAQVSPIATTEINTLLNSQRIAMGIPMPNSLVPVLNSLW